MEQNQEICPKCQAPIFHWNGHNLCSECDFTTDSLDKLAKEMSKVCASRSAIDAPEWLKGSERTEIIFDETGKDLNPYLRDMLFLAENNEAIIRDNPSFRMDMNTMFRLKLIRELLVYKYAWAIPCKKALESIAEHSPIIEVGAGSGFWAKLLNEKGVEIVAYDSISDGGSKNYLKKWFDVRQGNEQSILPHPDHTLFLCWPPYGDEMATDALKQYKGKTVLYVGEEYGVTASPSFFEFIEEHFVEEEVIELPVWPGLRDKLFVFTRKKNEQG